MNPDWAADIILETTVLEILEPSSIDEKMTGLVNKRWRQYHKKKAKRNEIMKSAREKKYAGLKRQRADSHDSDDSHDSHDY